MNHDKRTDEVKRLRSEGLTWRAVASKMGLSVSRCRQLEKLDTGEPSAPERKSAPREPEGVVERVRKRVFPTDADQRRAACRVILSHRLRGEPMPKAVWKEVRDHDDLRVTGPFAQREVIRQMRDDGASMDQLEKYVEAFVSE